MKTETLGRSEGRLGVVGRVGAPVRTAVDQVVLGSTGLRLSRLGMGTGSHNGAIQRELGADGFRGLVHEAFDRGITFIDASRTYQTFDMIAGAIKGLPRERLFIQSKIPGQPEDVLQEIDAHRKMFNTDYIDSMLIHCMFKEGWTDEWKRIMEGFNEAQERQWIRARGVSCHSLPALRAAVDSQWPQVHLVRVNPQGIRTDALEQTMWVKEGSPVHDIAPVMAELKRMKAKRRGVIGMKILGNGEFLDEAERIKSVRFAMAHSEVDAVVMGFKSAEEMDQAITHMNAALADAE